MSAVHEPVLVLYKSNGCRYCALLTNIWDTPPARGEDSIVMALKKVYPKLRIFVVTSGDNRGQFDFNTAPKGLLKYNQWFPMILLVPGTMWDNAMAKLGPDNDVPLIDGVQILNAVWKDGKLTLDTKPAYDIRKPGDFGRWLAEALENPDFKRVQSVNSDIPTSSTNLNPIIVPSTGVSSNILAPTPLAIPIPPLLSNIVKPTSTVPESMPVIEHGICSMHIISRPYK